MTIDERILDLQMELESVHSEIMRRRFQQVLKNVPPPYLGDLVAPVRTQRALETALRQAKAKLAAMDEGK